MKNASVSTEEIGQIGELYAAGARGMTKFLQRLPTAQRQNFIGNSMISDAVAQALESLLPKRMIIPHQEVERWNKYYRDEHGITHHFEGLEIPAEAEYPTRLIIMHGDVSTHPQRIAPAYKKRCNDKWWQRSDDLDTAVPRHSRNGTYAIRVADVAEAPDGFENGENLSSQQTWGRGWITTTLPERLVDGDLYLLEKKVHLDRKVITLCPGSRFADGGVPGVNFDSDDGRVKVHDWHPGNARYRLRFRRAII